MSQECLFLFVKMFSVQENDKQINRFHFSKVTYQGLAFQNREEIEYVFSYVMKHY